ncbi:hypothetical protein D3C78_1835120 [compost metagenome]
MAAATAQVDCYPVAAAIGLDAVLNVRPAREPRDADAGKRSARQGQCDRQRTGRTLA